MQQDSEPRNLYFNNLQIFLYKQDGRCWAFGKACSPSYAEAEAGSLKSTGTNPRPPGQTRFNSAMKKKTQKTEKRWLPS